MVKLLIYHSNVSLEPRFVECIKDCTSFIISAFSSLKGRQKWCKILIDEISNRRYNIKDITLLDLMTFMVSPLMGGSSFIARLIPIRSSLIPIYSLDHELLFDQINRLIKILNDCSGYVYLVMTDNLWANQSLFLKMHEFYGSKYLWSVTHPINNEEFEELFVLYDPTHLFKTFVTIG